MKKIIAVLLVALLVSLCLVSCGGDKKENGETPNTNNTPTVETPTDTPTPPVDEGNLDVGDDTEGENYGDFIPYK